MKSAPLRHEYCNAAHPLPELAGIQILCRKRHVVLPGIPLFSTRYGDVLCECRLHDGWLFPWDHLLVAPRAPTTWARPRRCLSAEPAEGEAGRRPVRVSEAPEMAPVSLSTYDSGRTKSQSA